jgi:hypothetical protein
VINDVLLRIVRIESDDKMKIIELLKIVYTHIPLAIRFLYSYRNSASFVFEQNYSNVGYQYKEKELIVRDMKRSLWLYGIYYEEYIAYDFYNKTKDYKKSFISQADRFKYYNKLNKRKNLNIFNDKYLTYKTFKQYYHREIIKIEKPEDYQKFYEFVKKNPKFVVKPYNSSCGEGVTIYNTVGYDESNVKSLFDKIILSGISVCEQFIIQRNEIASFNKTSVNTLRVTTVLTGKDLNNYQVHIFSAVLRLGKSGSIVDNFSAGGIVVQINPLNGKLNKYGRDESGNTYKEHPESKVLFEDFVIPEWDKAQELVKQLALKVPSNRYTGWDLALTDSGWVMVEGNASGQFFVLQLSDRVGKKAQLNNLCKLI